MEQPDGAVAWFATPHGCEGYGQAVKGITKMYDDKELVVEPSEGGYWICHRGGAS